MFSKGKKTPLCSAIVWTSVGILLTLGLGNPALAVGFSDDFEDGVINPSLWVTHGYIGGIGGRGSGSWQYSFTEVLATDGYLQARVWGPVSGNTYGAEAGVRTAYNFNDGRSWLINFTWATTVGYLPNDSMNIFAIQITDGATHQNFNFAWPFNEPLEGTVNLWRANAVMGAPPYDSHTPLVPFPKTDWSLLIEPSGAASLYQTPNAQGTAFSQVSLDTSRAWHVQFLEDDATSAGYNAGDNTFKLYSFSANTFDPVIPEPATYSLLLALGALAAYCRRRR